MIPLQYQAIAAVGIAIITFFIGRENGLSKYYDLQSAVELERAAAEARAEAINADTAKGWAAAVDYWRRNPRIVRVQSPNCPLPVPNTTGLTTGASEEPRFGATSDVVLTVEQCEARINAAVLDAAQLTILQAWIKQQHEAAK